MQVGLGLEVADVVSPMRHFFVLDNDLSAAHSISGYRVCVWSVRVCVCFACACNTTVSDLLTQIGTWFAALSDCRSSIISSCFVGLCRFVGCTEVEGFASLDCGFY